MSISTRTNATFLIPIEPDAEGPVAFSCALERMTRLAVVVVSVLGSAGCVSMSNLSAPSQSFVAAAGALAQAESDYFDEIQAASDSSYRLQATELYVAHSGTFADFIGKLNQHNDFSKAKALRVGAMRQLQNYAQQISAISNGADAPWISDDAKASTTNIATLINDAGATAASQLVTAQAGTIETAVTDLGRAIINHESAKELQALAQEAKGPIAQIADMVKQDNELIEADNFSASLKADETQAFHDILHFIYDDKTVNASERLNAVQMATSWKPSLITMGLTIQSALEKLEAANNAMAQKQDPKSVAALAQQAYTLAKQATQAPPANGAAPAK